MKRRVEFVQAASDRQRTRPTIHRKWCPSTSRSRTRWTWSSTTTSKIINQTFIRKKTIKIWNNNRWTMSRPTPMPTSKTSWTRRAGGSWRAVIRRIASLLLPSWISRMRICWETTKCSPPQRSLRSNSPSTKICRRFVICREINRTLNNRRIFILWS